MKSTKLSDQVRSLAVAQFVEPARRSGSEVISISVRRMLDILMPLGFPRGHAPQVCSALQTARFLEENDLEIARVDGPPSKVSSSVVVHYRVTKGGGTSAKPEMQRGSYVGVYEEDPRARAHRLSERLRGLLKEELGEYGGGEAFLRWIRSEDGETA